MNLPRHWRLRSQRYALVGEVCNKCGAFLFPPRDICPKCSQQPTEPTISKSNGHSHSRVTLLQAIQGCGEFVPYTVSLRTDPRIS